MMNDNNQDIRHPLFGTSLMNWFRLLIENGGADWGFLSRAIFITLSTMLTLPMRLLSKLVYDPRIEKTRINYPPLFIIGHWRSGTTHLHELISQDPLMGYVSFWHTLIPYSFMLLEDSKRFLARFLPTTRPMDAIKVQ